MAEFWTSYGMPTALTIAYIVAIVLVLLGAVAYLTLVERKVIAAMQLRKGPNVVGPFGLLGAVGSRLAGLLGLGSAVPAVVGRGIGPCTVRSSGAIGCSLAPVHTHRGDEPADR